MREKGKTMKAWTVRGIDSDYATVVFAETVGKAKAIAVGTDACEDYCFKDIRAYRFKEMDKFYRGKMEMDWYNDEDRTALVKAGWYCLDPYEWECEACCARELCERSKDDE